MVNTSYADVKGVPLKPPSAPTSGAGSSTTQIEVVIAPLTGNDTGGSQILSYHIEFDDATAGASWTELQGLSTNSLQTSHTVTGLTMARAYRFRYRARNIFGWSSSFSDEVTISTVTAPSQVNAALVTISVSGTNVVLAWTAPSSNGSPILEY